MEHIAANLLQRSATSSWANTATGQSRTIRWRVLFAPVICLIAAENLLKRCNGSCQTDCAKEQPARSITSRSGSPGGAGPTVGAYEIGRGLELVHQIQGI